MRRSSRFIAVGMLAFVVTVGLLPGVAVARTLDFAGAASSDRSSSEGTSFSADNGDLYRMGQSIDYSGRDIDSGLNALGQDVAISGCSVGGDVDAFSQNLTVDATSVSGTLAAAAQSIVIGGGTRCDDSYLVAGDIGFSGTTGELVVIARDITISGTVDGDAYIYAQSVTVTSDASITGTLKIRSTNAPQVASGAKVGTLDARQTGSWDTTDTGSSLMPLLLLAAVLGALLFISLVCLVALAIGAFFPRAVYGAADMVRHRTAQHLITGVVGMIAVIPVALLLLLLAPLSAAFMCVVVAVCLVAIPFAGASLGHLVFPRWNRIGAAAFGGLISGAICLIPVLRVIAIVAAFIYLFGYILQSIYLGMKGFGAPSAGAEQLSSAPVPPEGWEDRE